MEKVLNNMFLGERKQGNSPCFTCQLLNPQKAIVVMCDFAFQNCNTVTVTQKIVFKTVIL